MKICPYYKAAVLSGLLKSGTSFNNLASTYIDTEHYQTKTAMEAAIKCDGENCARYSACTRIARG